ncbi:MAG: transglutaminaseTgpA domain-containing protein [Pseudomonadales bacterium]
MTEQAIPQNDSMATTSTARTGVVNQIPRNALALLMVAQLAALLPHMQQQSLWIMGVATFCGFWRTQVYRGRWGYPGTAVKALLVLLSVLGVAFSDIPGVSLEAATSLLLLAFALKLLEMKTRRDAYLVIFLCYFVIATEFLFNQSLLLAIYEVAATVLVTAALIGLNQVHAEVRPLASLKIASTLIAQALPLTVVLFLFFPRIAPLWSMPLPNSAKTGISDRMKPGDVATLTRSDELAFRAVFEDDLPRFADLYWRGLVYTDFTEGTWSVPVRDHRRRVQARRTAQADAKLRAIRAEAVVAKAPELSYLVFLEPTASDWLFALDVAVPRQSNIRPTQRYTLEARNPVMSVFRYRVDSYPDAEMDVAEVGAAVQAAALTLPAASDESPRIRQWAEQRYKAVNKDPLRFIDAIQSFIRQQPFHYTLNPPQLSDRHSVDEFWFETRRGFCTHYAGATVFALRAVNIPARMVGGYQGGTVNPITNHVEVRQYDAHAWVEAWVEGQGWVRVDPTAAVAPQRIEQGLSAALSLEDRGALSLFASARLGQGGLLASALEWMDSLEHRWNLWVVGYDEGQQRGILQQLLGDLSPTKIGLAMLAGGTLSLGLVSALLFWRQRPRHRHPLLRAFSRLCDAGAAAGIARTPNESPAAYVPRLAHSLGLEAESLSPLVASLTDRLYNPNSGYGGRSDSQLVRQLRRLRLRIAFSARKVPQPS